ncbi:MAG: putative toxin-antitoxin system toxin component, PIN family [Candidatus Saccharimonadales bacterium]
MAGSDALPVAGRSKKQPEYRIVVDTSVLIGAIFFGGSTLKVLRHIMQHQTMILSDFIIEELVQFTKNTTPRVSYKMQHLMREKLSTYVRVYDVLLDVEIRDPNDLDIVRLAITHDAMIVSSDKDLQALKDVRVTVVSPAEYAALFFGKA